MQWPQLVHLFQLRFYDIFLEIQTMNPAGIVPALILTIFLGVFGLFTAKLLVDFKLNHPEVHSMGMFRILTEVF